ncbi:MerR family transcriptional regulator [Specibacter cremeus]|uniref:MerR family transcriptional regulator n=1 Tax=Specibacter cremeus TaxID=1629051 RepID=UPI000F7AABAA|nr:MerR family transcriptional regulator [Specibacter cremeus]
MNGLNSRVLRTVEIARATGYSVQQIRDLERLGVIPPATRTATGYRSYAPIHVQAVRAYRALARAVGPVPARCLLADLRTGCIEAAAATICALYVELARERGDVLRAREALRTIGAEATGRHEDTDDDAMTISELASALGVRPSTLRHWDAEGLAVPERVTYLRVRWYGPAAVREARIVAALRSGGYGIASIRDVMSALRRLEGIRDVDLILHRRLDQIAARTVSLLRAGTDLAAVIEACPAPDPPLRAAR